MDLLVTAPATTVRYSHKDGNESRVEGVAFKYRSSGKRFTLNNMSIKSAHLFYDWDAASTNRSGAPPWSGTTVTHTSGTEPSDAEFVIKKVDINDITLENPASGDKIRVNCLCPGITEATGVWSNVSADYIENMKLPREEVVKKFTSKVPLGRLAHVEDVVNATCFLASSKADYMTGQAINITGGREMH